MPRDNRLVFDIPNTGWHAGWVQLQVMKAHDDTGADLNYCSWATAAVIDYAYETEPGVPILAGDTGIIAEYFGDTDRDGDVDLDDLNNVRNHFGAIAG